MSLLFTDKYQPEKIEGFIGNNDVVKKVLAWAQSWKIGSKPLLLYGSPGIGKTLLSYLITKEMNWDIFELNSSDNRSKEVIENNVLNAALGNSLSGKRRMVLIDEIDVMFKGDRGGYQGILKLLREAKVPVMLTANNIYAKQQLASIRSLCENLQMKRINYLSIFSFLKKVCEKEGINYVPDVLKELAKNSNGDIRAALLDLQTLSGENISYGSLFSSRERKKDVFKVMNSVFFGKKDYISYKEGVRGMDIDAEMFFNWLEENLPRQNLSEGARKGFEYLSKADLFEGRIRYRQYWGFRRYSLDIAGFGCLLNRERKGGWNSLQFPSYIRYLSSSKSSRSKKNEIAKKLSSKMHSSSKDIIRSDFPFFKILLDNEEFILGLNRKYELDGEEIAFLQGKKKAGKKLLELLQKEEPVVVLDKNQKRLFEV